MSSQYIFQIISFVISRILLLGLPNYFKGLVAIINKERQEWVIVFLIEILRSLVRRDNFQILVGFLSLAFPGDYMSVNVPTQGSAATMGRQYRTLLSVRHCMLLYVTEMLSFFIWT